MRRCSSWELHASSSPPGAERWSEAQDDATREAKERRQERQEKAREKQTETDANDIILSSLLNINNIHSFVQ